MGAYRFIPVILLLGVAAALATPPGRLPLALRGLKRMLSNDTRESAAVSRPTEQLPLVRPYRRWVSFLLTCVAFVLAVFG